MNLLNVDEFLKHFDGVKKSGNTYKAFCPCHKDEAQSLSITPTDNKILLNCFAGCKSRDILETVGLKWKDLRILPKWAYKLSEEVEAVYDYGDYVKVRFEHKKIRYGIVTNRGFKEGLNGKSRTLYKIDTLKRQKQKIKLSLLLRAKKMLIP